MDSSPGALLQPFAAERYAGRDLSPVIAPPYDVISPVDRAALARQSPHNIVHLILPEGNGDRYEHAARLYRQWRADGVLVRDSTPSVYVITQRSRLSDGRETLRTGMLAALAAEPYAARRVRPHEKTHAGPKADRLSLMRSLRATFESIFVIAPDQPGSLRERLAGVALTPATAEGSIGDVEVRLWRVSGADAIQLTTAVEGAPVYIADGHHRYETTLAYRAENPAASRTAALVVPASDPGLTVLATHRILQGKPLGAQVVRELLDPWFVVTDLGREAPADALRRLGRNGTGCVVAVPDAVLGLAIRPEALRQLEADLPDPTVRALDVARVDHLVVAPLRERSGAERPLEYTPDLDLAQKAVHDGAPAAVLLNPTSVAQVFAVADAQGVMPQKSTYFVPKVPSGLAGLSYDNL
jgi:uncharacterized protein (DUF1015 family)